MVEEELYRRDVAIAGVADQDACKLHALTAHSNEEILLDCPARQLLLNGVGDGALTAAIDIGDAAVSEIDFGAVR